MVALPLVVWFLLFLGMLRDTRGAREAALVAFAVVSAAVLAFTEVLSVFNAVSAGWIASCWLVLVCVSVAFAHRRLLDGARQALSLLRCEWDTWAIVTATVLCVFGLGSLMSALLYPISNYDSLTAHAPRVFFWIQNRSIAHYPTAFGPQLFESPLGAYFVLNLKLLSGGTDRYANVVQWLSYAFSVLTVTLVARSLGASRRGQQVAAIIAASVPMAVLQASTTQNDLNCALWSLAAVYGALAFIVSPPRDRDGTVRWVAFTGAALGLAFQAKPLAYMFCFPFFAWLLIVALRREGWRRTASLALSVLLAALLLNGPWYGRNARALDGDVIGFRAMQAVVPKGLEGNTEVLVKSRDARAFLTTALKNVSMQLGTPSSQVNRWSATAVVGVVRAYGGDPEDRATKESGAPYRIDSAVTSHDVGPSPVTFLIIVLSAVVLMLPGGRRLPRAYLACAVAALCLPATLLTWNPYVNRLMLGSVLLLVPCVGVAASRHFQRARVASALVLVAGVSLSVLWGAAVLAFNSTNRLISPSLAPFVHAKRDLGYWNTSYDDLRFRILTPELEAPFETVAEGIRRERISRVGLSVRTGGTFPIYPLLWLVREHRIAYVRDTVLPQRIDSSGFDPEAIIEVLPREQYPAALGDGRPRGRPLALPQLTDTLAILTYAAP